MPDAVPLPLPNDPKTIRVRTLSGSNVSAPIETWVQALVLSLPPVELERLLQFVAQQQQPLTLDTRPIPADPNAFLPKGLR